MGVLDRTVFHTAFSFIYWKLSCCKISVVNMSFLDAELVHKFIASGSLLHDASLVLVSL